MKEIGGYFGLEQQISNHYHKGLIALNTARNALLYVLKSRNIKKLNIPFYLCSSVAKICDLEGYPYEYYSVTKDFMPSINRMLDDKEYIYIVNYFGQLDNYTILELKKKYRNIIVDNVQAFFQKPLDGVDTIYSCRKFFGVPDGAYLSTNCFLNEDIKIDESRDRMSHILGRFETGNASYFYSDFVRNDALLDNVPLKRMSKLTRNILDTIDYSRVQKIREHNFQILDEALGNKNKLKTCIPISPFAYPFYYKDGIELRRKLIDKKIYVPILWPNALKSDDKIAREYSKNILPLPCDQRYNEKDMHSVFLEVLKCID